MTPEQLHRLFEYNQWANRRTLDTCAALSDEQFKRELGSSFASIRDTLAHLCGAEWIWHQRLLGRSNEGRPTAAMFPDLPALRAKLDEIDNQLVQYVSKSTAADLERFLDYKNQAGQEFSSPIWQILQHLANHGTYHRGQVVTMLRQLGGTAVSTDLIGFYRECASAGHS